MFRPLSHIYRLRNPLLTYYSRSFFNRVNYSTSICVRHNQIHDANKSYISRTPLRKLHISFPLFEIRTVKSPPFAESVSEGDIRWEKEIGDTVAEDDLVGVIETDKTGLNVPAPCAGVITEFLVEEGGKVVAGQELFKIEVGAVGETPAKSKSPEPQESKSQEPEAPAAKKSEDSSAAASTGSGQGKVIAVKQPPSDLKSLNVVSDKASMTVPGSRTEQRVKMNRMRQRIAQRLKEAQNTCAMLTTFNEIDMSNLFDLRQKYKEAFLKKHGVKLGFMSAFAKGSALALHDQPIVNGVIDQNEIVYRDYIDISIAVATPKGLVVPVIRNVETMNFADIEKTINGLGLKARNGELAIEDMDGGTFTISNGGVFGSMFGTPIINLPQSAILGLHGVFERPVAHNGQVVIRPMMYVALTYDHRLIDGREAVLFLRKIKSFIEDPRILFLDL